MPWKMESDQLLTVTGLVDPTTSTFVNDATVEATMTDMDGVEVVGQSWPLTLAYVAASDGDYQALLEDDRVLIEGQFYFCEMVADAGGDLIKTWKWKDVAVFSDDR
jgi:hypothetical protein